MFFFCNFIVNYICEENKTYHEHDQGLTVLGYSSSSSSITVTVWSKDHIHFRFHTKKKKKQNTLLSSQEGRSIQKKKEEEAAACHTLSLTMVVVSLVLLHSSTTVSLCTRGSLLPPGSSKQDHPLSALHRLILTPLIIFPSAFCAKQMIQ
jgi:hypothetical protein